MPRRIDPACTREDVILAPLATGTCLLGRFELFEPLGRGGMGTVYRARDAETGRIVALKVLAIDDAPSLRRFRREFRAAERLDHANVVTVHFFHPGPPPFFSMDFVPGVPLTRYAGEREGNRRNDGDRVARIRAVLRQLLEGLAHIHAHGLVHRDLKPENLLVTEAGKLSIMDFGVVRSRASTGELTQGRIVGTLSYMSPEQLEGLSVDARSDLYSVGAILYELLTGEPPFDASQFGSLARAVLHETPPLPQSLNPGVDPTLAAFAMTLLEKKPWQRFASAEAALAVLETKHVAPDARPRRPALLVPQFAGRDGEVAVLKEALERLAAGKGGPLLFTGPAGCGKTRLLAELVSCARDAGTTVLSLRGSAAEGGLANALAMALELPGPTSTTWSRELLPALARRERAGRVVLVLDDADRLDAAGQRLLADLARELWAAPVAGDVEPAVLLIATAGEGPGPATPGLRVLREVVMRQRLGALLSLRPLSLAETETMVRSMLGETRIPQALATWVHQTSGGYPFYIAETVRELVLGGWLSVVDGQLRLDGERLGRPQRAELQVCDFEGLPVPRGVREIILSGLERLGPEARSIAITAALAGEDCDFDLLLAATGQDEERLYDAVEALLASGLLIRAAPGEDRLRFAHDRAREVIAALAPPAEAAALHAALARALEGSPSGRADPVALARHYDLAGLGTEALRHLPAAAELLSARQAHGEAADCWARYLELEPPEPEAVAQARRKLARELGYIGRVAEAKAVLESILVERGALPDRLELVRELVFLEIRMGNYGDAVMHACDLLAIARGHSDRGEQARALRVLASAQLQHGHFAGAELSFRDAVQGFRAIGDRAGLAAALRGLGATVGAQGRLEEAAAQLQEALAWLRGLAALLEEQSTLLELGTVHLNQGALDRALDCYTQSLQLARKLRRGERLAMVECNLGYALTLAGDYGEAEHALARCLRYTTDGRNPMLDAAAHGNRAILRRHAGDFEGARSDAEHARAALGETAHPGLEIELAVELARIEQDLGYREQARRLARTALRRAREHHLPWHEAEARIALGAVLEGRSARAQLKRARDLAESMGAEMLLARALIPAASLEEGLGDAEGARALREQAGRILGRIARRLGVRERMFLRTRLVREALGFRSDAEPPAGPVALL